MMWLQGTGKVTTDYRKMLENHSCWPVSGA